VRQGGDNLPLNRDTMRVDLVVERLAEGNGVFSSLVGGCRLVVVVEPEMEFVKKMKAR